ncbi:MAG: hypothetical protein C6H99_03355 [Epsilonproteobacteria bacterium]|nr:hypothetical protein [Campylobacterota bacterium]NPA64509.1 hypothetical protein [Campylobacterota bacterium]
MRRFIFLYLLYLAIAFLLIDYTPMREALGIESRYNAFIANLTAPLVEAAGIGARADGEILRLPHANMIIKFGCNGLEAVLIYLAGVLAYPAPWRSNSFGVEWELSS